MTYNEAVQWLYSAVPNFQRDGGSQGNFSLAGRGMVSEAMPVNICQIPGTVILNIWVNREGKVIDVETAAGTTITDSCPIDRAKAAAQGTKFTRLRRVFWTEFVC